MLWFVENSGLLFMCNGNGGSAPLRGDYNDCLVSFPLKFGLQDMDFKENGGFLDE